MSITWRAPFLVVSLIAAIALGGCGGSSGDSSTSAAASTPASTAADSGGGTAADTTADSGGGSGDDFCQKLENVGRNLQDQGASIADPQKMGEFFAQVEDALKAADPPSELQNEWNTLQDLFGTFAKAFKDADFTDPQSLSKLQDDLQQFQDKQDELASATTALSRYAAEHCGGAF